MDLVAAMKEHTETGVELSVEERNLLSVGYKNLVGEHRKAWRAIMNVEHYMDSEDVAKSTTQEYRQKIEKELRAGRAIDEE